MKIKQYFFNKIAIINFKSNLGVKINFSALLFSKKLDK